MNQGPSALPPELESFVGRRRVTRQVPAAMRVRVLARAGRPVAPAGAESGTRAQARVQDRSAAPRVPRLARIAIAASVLLAAGSVWGIVALRGRTGEDLPVLAPKLVPVHVPAPRTDALPPVPAGAAGADMADAPLAVPRPARRRGGATRPGDPLTVELQLLQQAQGAYMRRDLGSALALLAEHARRFPNGRLAEEREALRVRALLAAGRRGEAHRVAAAFAADFPHSALLQRLEAEESAPR